MRFAALRSALLAACALAPAAPALADEVADAPDRDYLPSDILVLGEREGYATDDGSSGTKTPTPIIEVPQSIAFLTEDQLDDQAITQLSEALLYVPGVAIETGEGHRNEIFIRGQETTSDFYLDGLRDDAQYYRSLYNIERIEVLKGANALIFGRGGGGGVVNRVSKKGRLGETFARLDASADSFGAFVIGGDVNGSLGAGAAARLNAAYEEFDSHRDFYEGRFIGVAPTVKLALGEATALDLSYSYDDDERVVDRGVPALGGRPLAGFDDTFFGDPAFNRADSQVHIARARLEHAFSDSLSANATLQYANYDKVYANVLPSSATASTVDLTGYEDTTDRENWIAQANLVWQGRTGALGHTLLAGVEASRQDTANSRRNVLFAAPGGGTASRVTVPLAERIAVPAVSLTPVIRSRDSQLEVLSAYLQDQLEIGDHVEIVAGLRWDRFDLQTVNLLNGTPGDRVDEKVSPRLALVFKPSERLSFYAAYAESFLPQAGDQFLILSPGETAFEPEKFTNYEIGAKWAIAPELLFTAALFRLERTNTTAPDPANTGLTVLTGESRTEGLELNLVGQIAPRWQANLGYAYLDGEITSTSDFAPAGTRLQQLPRHNLSAWNRYDVTDRFGLGLGVIYQAEQFASFSQNVVLPDWIRVDAAAYFEVSERLALQVNVENLFDETYYPSAHGDNNIQPAEPFSVRFGVRLSL